MLAEIEEAEQAVNINRLQTRQPYPRNTSRPQPRKPPRQKFCRHCHSSDKPSNHDITECPIVSFAEKRQLARAFQVSVSLSYHEDEYATVIEDSPEQPNE